MSLFFGLVLERVSQGKLKKIQKFKLKTYSSLTQKQQAKGHMYGCHSMEDIAKVERPIYKRLLNSCQPAKPRHGKQERSLSTKPLKPSIISSPFNVLARLTKNHFQLNRLRLQGLAFDSSKLFFNILTFQKFLHFLKPKK